MLDGLHVEQLAFCIFSAWISNHAGGSPNQRDGIVAGALPMYQKHHGHKVANVQGIRSGVKSDVTGDVTFCEGLFKARSHVVEHSTPAQFIDKIHGRQR